MNAKQVIAADCHKTFMRLCGCFDVEPDADTFRSIKRLCERLHEEATRGEHIYQTHQTLAWVRRKCPPQTQD